MHRTSLLVVAMMLAMGIMISSAVFADPADKDESTKKATPDAAGESAGQAEANSVDPAITELAAQQGRIASRYERLEELLLKLKRFEEVKNPRRAKLLEQAFKQSKDKYTLKQMEAVVDQLRRKKLRQALDGQTSAKADLLELLELLKKESREERIKQERDRYKEYLKEVERLIRIQQGLRGQNEGGFDAEKLAKSQDRTADRTGGLGDKIDSDNKAAGGEGSNSENDGKNKGASEGKNKGDSEGKSKGDSEGKGKGDSEGKNKGDSEGNNKGDSEGKGKGDSEGKSKGDSEGKSKGDSEGKSKGDSEGKSKGDSEGKSKGDSEGKSKGDSEGKSKGDSEGKSKGDSEGKSKGDSEGKSKGDSEGKSKGDSEGKSKGDSEGKSKGDSEGNSKGDSEGNSKGDSEGNSKGDSEGDSKGDSEGNSKGDSESSPQQEIRKRIKEAEKRMREAKRKLEEAKRKESIKDQEAAEEELKKAKKALEEILRQLREEEIERVLAMLEGRFREMLERELRVYEGTKKLDKIVKINKTQPEQIEREIGIESKKLSDEQHEIAVMADRALELLREEGSSVAFPETVEQLRDDMEHVSKRLTRAKVGAISQQLEEEIIDVLDYIIDALVKAQQEQDEKEQQQQEQQQQQQEQDQPLVDAIAELKLIRGLEERVYKRHTRYSRLLEDPDDPVGQTDDPDIREALRRLAERQEKIQRITRDIVLGKNK